MYCSDELWSFSVLQEDAVDEIDTLGFTQQQEQLILHQLNDDVNKNGNIPKYPPSPHLIVPLSGESKKIKYDLTFAVKYLSDTGSDVDPGLAEFRIQGSVPRTIEDI